MTFIFINRIQRKCSWQQIKTHRSIIYIYIYDRVQSQTHKGFKRTLIYYDTDAQSAHFGGNPLRQATKWQTTVKGLKMMKNEMRKERTFFFLSCCFLVRCLDECRHDIQSYYWKNGTHLSENVPTLCTLLDFVSVKCHSSHIMFGAQAHKIQTCMNLMFDQSNKQNKFQMKHIRVN